MLLKIKERPPITAARIEKWRKSLSKICFIFIIVSLSLLTIRFFSLNKTISNSKNERNLLRTSIDKIETMREVNKVLFNDLLRQKAVDLCFQTLTRNYYNKVSSKEKQECIQLIMTSEGKFKNRGIDAPLILAWLEKESGGNPEAVSWAGAKGLTQLMDFRGSEIFSELGYSGRYKNLVFNPVINLTSGLYHLDELLDHWESEGIKNQSLVLFYAIHSYKWGSKNTQQLFNNEKRSLRPAIEYVNWILNRREYWVEKLEDLIEDAQKQSNQINEISIGSFKNG